MSSLPDPESRYEAEGIPDQGELTAEQAATGQDEGVLEPPHDYPLAVEDFGTTPQEQLEGESLDGQLAREQSSEDPVVVDGGPAEEAAMHLEPETEV